MAQSAETLDRFDLGNNVREDLSDIIYNISPTEVPMQSNFGRGTSQQTFKEWQIDELVDAANNAAIDGDEFAGDALDKASRLGNYSQISRKDIVVSRRANIVNKAGRKSEIAYQIAKKGKELRRDVEYALARRKAAVVGNSTTAMESAGVPAWITTNFIGGAGAVAPTLSGTTEGYPDSAGTSTGTAMALSEADILASVRGCYDEGGNPNMIMMGTQLKQGLSTFLFGTTSNRIATQYQDQGANPRGGITVVGAVDVYVTDFSVLDIVPNRFVPSGDGSVTDPTAGTDATRASEVYILDSEYWKVSYLDGYKTETIAKIGDHERRMLLVDWTLCSLNEAASAIITGINSSTAVAA
jgi:hypothetical protein